MGSIASGIGRMFTLPGWLKPQNPAMPPDATPPTIADPAIAALGARARARMASVGGMGFGGTVKNAGGPGGIAPGAPTTKAGLTGAA